MGERRLTVRDRIIVHLAGLIRFTNEFECPEEMSQAGISRSIGKSRAHTTLELNRMEEAGLVAQRLAHVKGARSKRKTYSLTPAALERNSEIVNHVQGIGVEITEDQKKHEINGLQAADIIMQKLGLPRPIAYEKVMSSGGALDIDEMVGRSGITNTMELENCHSALNESRENSTLEGRLLKANVLSRKGDLQSALELLSRSEKECSSKLDYARLHFTKAIIYRKKGDTRAALREINKSQRSLETAAPSLELGRCSMEKAMILMGTGNLAKARQLLDKAMEIFGSQDSQVDMLRCRINSGILHRNGGSTKEAVRDLEIALDLAEKTGLDRFRGYALVNLADIRINKGDYQASRELSQKASEIFSVLDESLMQAASLFNLGASEAGLGERDSSMHNLDRSIRILKDNGLLESRTSWLQEYAEILESLGESDKADSILREI